MRDVTEQDRADALAGLYAGVTTLAAWPDFLDRFQRCIDARFLMAGCVDPQNPEGHFFSAPTGVGQDGVTEFLAIAAEHHVDGFANLLSRPPRDILFSDDIYDDQAELKDRPLMRHLKTAYGADDIGAVNAQANGAWIDYITFGYGADQAYRAADIRKAVAFFLPHVAIANETRRTFVMLAKKHQAMFNALNYLGLGVALLDADQRVVLTNTEFDRIIAEKDALRRKPDGRLAALDEDANNNLQTEIFAALCNSSGRTTREERAAFFALDRRSGLTPYIVDVAPISETVDGELNMALRGALVFVIDPEERAALSPHGLAAAYDFTAAEKDVVRLLLEGLSNDEIADARNVGLATVKTHLQSVFGKARVKGRTDLTRLAVKVSPPIRGGKGSDTPKSS